jgi:hypothetical protein
MATPAQWTAAVEEGRHLWAKLQARLADPQDSDRGELLVDDEYDATWTQAGAWLDGVRELQAFLDEDYSVDNYSLAEVQCKGTTHTPYKNAMNGKDGVVVCIYNFKDQDFSPEPRMRWTTIIGQLGESQAEDPTNLSLICRCTCFGIGVGRWTEKPSRRLRFFPRLNFRW